MLVIRPRGKHARSPCASSLTCEELTHQKIAPLQFRHIGAAAGAFGEWLFCFITVFAGGIGLNNVGWKLWLWCLASCVVAIPFVWFMCPETTGKKLEEIDSLFEKNGNTRALHADLSSDKDIDYTHQEEVDV